jgi:hypothetical protein
MNHFTMSTPDVEAHKRFWIDFMGGSWYSESHRLVQFLIGGILVDCFPPQDASKEEDQPKPGSAAQAFRFSILPDVLGDWVARAEKWQMRSQLVVQEELRRLILIFFAPGGYHVGLETSFATAEELRAAVAAYGARVARLNDAAATAR